MSYSSTSAFGAFNPTMPGCGDTKEDVLFTQRALNALGFTDAEGRKLREDGMAGTSTAAAMGKYSVARGFGFLGTSAQGDICTALWHDYKQLLSNPGTSCPPGQQRQFGMCVPTANLPGLQPQAGGTQTQQPTAVQTGQQACKADEYGVFPLCYKRSDAEAIAARLGGALQAVVPYLPGYGPAYPYAPGYGPSGQIPSSGMTTQAKLAVGVGGGILALAIIGGLIYATRRQA